MGLPLPLLAWLVWIGLAPEAPAAAAGPGAAAPPPEAIIAEIPFVEGSPSSRVMVDLAPEGNRPWIMMLDTGASANVVTPLMARELGVSVRRAKSTPYRRRTRLGRDVLFWVETSSSDTASQTGWEYGLLGGEFLDDYVLEIDFPGRRVRFLDPDKYEVPESTDGPEERVIPAKIGGTRVVVPVELNGNTVRMLLDTGAPDTLLLSGRDAHRAGLDVEALPEWGSVGTVKGPMPVRFLETEGFRLAGFEFGRVPALVAPRGWPGQGSGLGSVIGTDVLRQFIVRIDYRRRRVWLKRTGETRITFQGTDYGLVRETGAFVEEVAPGRFPVWRVEPDRAAARLGLQPQDIILEAAGEVPLTLEDVLRRIRDGSELSVARQRDGVWVDFILPDPLAPGDPSGAP